MTGFSRTVDILSRALDANTMRYQVTANNLANAEVPNFKRTSVNFESELKRAFDSEQTSENAIALTTNNPQHIQSDGVIDYTTVEPRLVTDYLTTTNANGNNVDAEQEAMEVLRIQLNYQLLTQLQNFQFSQMKVVLR